MNTLEHKSLKRRIKKVNNLYEVIDQMIVDWENWPLDLYFDIKKKLIDGYLVEESQFAKIVALSKSKTLYESRTFHHIPSLHLLFEAGIADRVIEMKICENVESEYASGLPTYLRDSLKILRDFGSKLSLDILEAIAFDHGPADQIAKLKNNLFAEADFLNHENQDYLLEFEKISTSLRVEVYRLLIDGIKRIKMRNSEPEERFAPWSTI